MYNTFIGGCVTILLALGVIVGCSVQLWSLYYHPEYMALPSTFEFNTSEAYELNARTSTVATLLLDPWGIMDAESNLRIVYNYGEIQAVYCKDLFADQIALETDDPSKYGNFYSETYADLDGSKWICPNVTSLSVQQGEFSDYNLITDVS